jgi:hypothetical protein
MFATLLESNTAYCPESPAIQVTGSRGDPEELQAMHQYPLSLYDRT